MAGLGGQILGHFWTPEGDERKRLILAKIGSISTCAQNGTKHIQCKFIFQRLFLAAFCALYLTPTRGPAGVGWVIDRASCTTYTVSLVGSFVTRLLPKFTKKLGVDSFFNFGS